MDKMTAKRVARIQDVIENIITNARSAVHRVKCTPSPDTMSDDAFKALAKEVEEVGELVHQLELANPHVVPALFEVTTGQWQGWSGLENYRNTLAHHFRSQTKAGLLDHVAKRLALREVADLLASVWSVAMHPTPFDFGEPSLIRSLPQTRDHSDLQPGSSLIALRFDENGELLAVRSWRDTDDHWRATTRWVRTEDEDAECVILHFCDTDLRMVPTEEQPSGVRDEYNLFVVPSGSFRWQPNMIQQETGTLSRRKK